MTLLCVRFRFRLDYTSSSHTRLIRRLTLKGLMQASIDKFGITN